MKRLLSTLAIVLSATTLYAQVPSMPDAAGVGAAAKAGAVAEVLEDSVKEDRALIDTSAIRNPMGKEEPTQKRNVVLITSICGVAIVLIAVAARRRRIRRQK